MRLAPPPTLIAGLLAVAALVLGVGCPHVCDATTCFDGCCGDDGICWVDNTDDKCGRAGASCKYCQYDEKCSQGACISCGTYGDRCTASASPGTCCESYSCTFDTYYGYNVCKL